jgi:hypothetical protein
MLELNVNMTENEGSSTLDYSSITPFDEEARQKIRAQLGPDIMQHPCMLRMERNIQEVGIQACEVYRIEGSTSDRNLYFDVYSLRKWASENAAPNMTGLDTGRLKALVEGGVIDPKRVEQMPLEKMLEPIIIGVSAHENGSDAVLDGQHRYVATAFKALHCGQRIDQFPIAARFLEPHQWQNFLIPRHIAVAIQADVEC